MKIRFKENELKIIGKSAKFLDGEDVFYIPTKFLRKEKNGDFWAVFPEWSTQIYAKHQNEFYTIFLQDFYNLVVFGKPIPFGYHFPTHSKVKKIPAKRYIPQNKTFSTPKNTHVEPFQSQATLEPSHDEIVLAKRRGEI